LPKAFLYIFFGLQIVLFAGCVKKSSLPDMRESYNYKDIRPFGGYVAYHILENSFSDNWIGIKDSPFAETVNWLSDDTSSIYVSISKKFYVDENDANALLNYVYKGNTVFIAASEIDTTLLSKIYCAQDTYDMMYNFMAQTYNNTAVRLITAVTNSDSNWVRYYYFPFINYFSKIEPTYCRKVGYNEKGLPNCIVLFWGHGKMYLHCDPRAFSNYFLLKENNYIYMKELLQILPKNPEHVYWDNFYNKRNYKRNNNFSTLNTIFKYPALKWAFWIAVLLLLLYIFFSAKRRQRIVPIVKPVQNSSIAFAEAIAGLYLKEKNNKIIAEKMITYFNEHVRSRYFLNTNVVNQDFLTALSRKSGVDVDATKNLYYTMQQIIDSPDIDDLMLLNLNEQIEQFYKNKN
jgi:hypothetical protein